MMMMTSLFVAGVGPGLSRSTVTVQWLARCSALVLDAHSSPLQAFGVVQMLGLQERVNDPRLPLQSLRDRNER